MKLWTARTFYRLMHKLSDVDFPVDAGDFRLADRRVAEVMRRMREPDRYLCAMFTLVGFRQTPQRDGTAPVVSLPPGGPILEASSRVSDALHLKRYSSDWFPIDAGALRGTAVLDIPTDRSTVPWQLQLGASGPVTVCGQRGS